MNEMSNQEAWTDIFKKCLCDLKEKNSKLSISQESTHLVGVEFDIKPSTQDHRELVAQNDDKIYLLNIRQS